MKIKREGGEKEGRREWREREESGEKEIFLSPNFRRKLIENDLDTAETSLDEANKNLVLEKEAR